MFFSGGYANKSKDGNSIQYESNERISNYKDSHQNSKIVRLQQPPSKINVYSTEGKEFEIQLLEGLLETYFGIVRTNIIDAVPKAIMYFLVAKSKQQMQNELVQALYKDQNFERLFEESPDITSRRNAAKNLLAVLHKAQNIINEVRDYKLPKEYSTNLEIL